MELGEAVEQVERLTLELLKARGIREAADQRIAGLEKILFGYLGLFPELYDDLERVLPFASEGEGVPRGASAVRRILHENPKEPMYVSEIVRQLGEHGWLPDSENPANAVRTALERLANSEDSDVYKGRHGTNVTYTYDPDRDRYEEDPF